MNSDREPALLGDLLRAALPPQETTSGSETTSEPSGAQVPAERALGLQERSRREDYALAWRIGAPRWHRSWLRELAGSDARLALPACARLLERSDVARLEAALARLTQRGGSMVLCGPRGTGKTTRALWLALVSGLESGDARSFAYHPWPDLVALARPQPQELALAAVRAWERAATADVLVVDECQEDQATAWARERWTALVDRRYRDALRTVVVTNATAEALPDVLGDSAASRLGERGRVLPCTWPPFR
jgi:hypothetical protein